MAVRGAKHGRNPPMLAAMALYAVLLPQAFLHMADAQNSRSKDLSFCMAHGVLAPQVQHGFEEESQAAWQNRAVTGKP
eukprot:1144560-Pelagomonas_calceolata.AAC.4